MLRRLSIGVLASAVALAPLPTKAQDGTAEDLGGVMSISLKDVVKPTIGFQGALQGAGTSNQAGIRGFLPLSVADNSVWFLDALVNVNFADRYNYSSIINTTVNGSTISTSTRLGYRWLNDDRSWMYGINAGYDTRPMATGYADTGVNVSDMKTVFFQQAAVNVEAVSDSWSINAYGLFPVGEEDHELNNIYGSGALVTVGGDVGYNITPELKASVGSYYQNGDHDDDGNPEVDNFGILGRLEYSMNKYLTIGANITYDESFDTRFSADIKWQLNIKDGEGKIQPKVNYAVKALVSAPISRTVRVHDGSLRHGGRHRDGKDHEKTHGDLYHRCIREKSEFCKEWRIRYKGIISCKDVKAWHEDPYCYNRNGNPIGFYSGGSTEWKTGVE